jgi:hypothetical protein
VQYFYPAPNCKVQGKEAEHPELVALQSSKVSCEEHAPLLGEHILLSELNMHPAIASQLAWVGFLILQMLLQERAPSVYGPKHYVGLVTVEGREKALGAQVGGAF